MNEKQQETQFVNLLQNRGVVEARTVHQITLLNVITIIFNCYTEQIITVVMHTKEQKANRLQLPAHQQLVSSVLRCHWIFNQPGRTVLVLLGSKRFSSKCLRAPSTSTRSTRRASPLSNNLTSLKLPPLHSFAVLKKHGPVFGHTSVHPLSCLCVIVRFIHCAQLQLFESFCYIVGCGKP